jgi:HD-GYP domain-containing protein (c-di-GMP phosphodiesterase class II)
MRMNVNALEIPKFSRQTQRRTKQLLKRGFATFESAHVRRDRSVMPVEVKARVIQSGERKLILSVTRDITERKRSEEDLEKSYKRLQKAMEGTTSAFELVTEMRDPYTSGHQRRTAKLAVAIAKEMGLSKERVETIQMAGSIHDIGKMYVPAEILSKPGQLTDVEFSLIKIHPKAGHDILRAAEATWPIAQIVLQHHERLNGSGYPQGLSGDQIMLEARILAVADTVEAMSSHRPYRPAFPIDVALSEVREKRGILFDPDAVDACLVLFRDGGFKFD